MLFLNSHGLGYTVTQSINPVNIISEDKTILARRHTPQVVAEHERAWTFLLEATADAPFEETMLAAQTLEQAWHVIVGWGLPTSDAEKALLVRQLETVQMELGEDPKIYFARVDKLLNTLKSVGIVKEEREIVCIIIRNLSDEYMVEKRSYLLTMPNISRFEVEETVRASYANRKYSDLGKLSVAVPAKAPPQVVINDPHALAVGGGLRGGGSGGQRQSRGGPVGGRRGQQQGGRGQQQQWSQGWNGQLPSHVGGQTRQQPFQQQYVHRQQQQHQYVHRQQQPQRYVHRQLQQQHQPHQQQYVRQQQQLLQPHRSSHHASPKWGIGGPFDCGSNATGWYQEESPAPPNSPMGGMYQCKRCGRLEHMAQICTTPQRFEGTCKSCGQYGHRHHNCIANTYHNTHAHANIISYPSGFNWGEAELCHGHSRIPNSTSLSSNSSATTVMADGSGGASTAVLVYLQRVATGVTVVYNNGTSVVTAQVMALVVATAAVATATTVIVGSILVVAMTATPLLPVVVIHRQIG